MRFRSVSRSLRLAAAILAVAAAPAAAQPFGAWAVFNGTDGYVEVPSASALNPSSAITIEAWVNFNQTINGENCKSIVGKNWQESYWVGVCNVGSPLTPTLRSYSRGSASAQTAGAIPNGKWTHIAVVVGGGHRKHYINGELALDVADNGALPSSTAPLRIGSDVEWEYSPVGAIDDVRIWNVARTQAQIREAINEIQGAQAGFVGNWRLDGGGADPVGGRNGSLHDAIAFLTFPVATGCSTTSTVLCLRNRFTVRGDWRTSTNAGSLGVVPYQTFDSGLFHFFGPSFWEIEIKLLDGCTINDRYWMYSAATTDLYYRMEVLDGLRGVQKIYFNYPGAPAPAVTDSDAFATCP